jgi:hypothetical protein
VGSKWQLFYDLGGWAGPAEIQIFRFLCIFLTQKPVKKKSEKSVFRRRTQGLAQGARKAWRRAHARPDAGRTQGPTQGSSWAATGPRKQLKNIQLEGFVCLYTVYFTPLKYTEYFLRGSAFKPPRRGRAGAAALYKIALNIIIIQAWYSFRRTCWR